MKHKDKKPKYNLYKKYFINYYNCIIIYQIKVHFVKGLHGYY